MLPPSLTLLRDIIREFFRSFFNPYTYHPFRNIYNLFGFLWGLPIPAVTIGITLRSMSLPLTMDSVLTVLKLDPILIFFLFHPFLFYVIFGCLGSMHKRRDDKILGESLQLAGAR